MNKKLISVSASTFLLSLPAVVFGQALVNFPSIPSLSSGTNLYQLILDTAALVLSATWIIAVAFVIIMFIIAGFKFLTAQGDVNKVKEARDAVIWGVGGVIVILLSFSILIIMRATLGI